MAGFQVPSIRGSYVFLDPRYVAAGGGCSRRCKLIVSGAMQTTFAGGAASRCSLRGVAGRALATEALLHSAWRVGAGPARSMAKMAVKI